MMPVPAPVASASQQILAVPSFAHVVFLFANHMHIYQYVRDTKLEPYCSKVASPIYIYRNMDKYTIVQCLYLHIFTP